MNGWVLYDGDCGLCRALVRRIAPMMARRGFKTAPLQEDWVRTKIGLPEDELMSEMRVLTPEDELIGGADAIVYLASRVWWAVPFAWAARLPGAMTLLRAGYRWVAENRGCRHGSCRRPETGAPFAWLPLALMTLGALRLRSVLPPWLFMWTLSAAIYGGYKWWMFRKAYVSGVRFTWVRALGFLFLWPGMDARSFSKDSVPGTAREWAAAAFKTALGSALFWGAARLFAEPLAAGWCGMIGLALLLHFGIFHLLSLAWRAAGADAEPLMNSPLLATSLGDFWGNRWNMAFRQLGYELVFLPFHRTTGVTGATAAIFLSSGLIHDLVISYPSGSGYGLPTAFFVLQGAGLILEKSALGRRLGLAHGLVGRLFAIVVVAGPAFWLFHPAFVRTVIIPFMKVAGAL